MTAIAGAVALVATLIVAGAAQLAAAQSTQTFSPSTCLRPVIRSRCAPTSPGVAPQRTFPRLRAGALERVWGSRRLGATAVHARAAAVVAVPHCACRRSRGGQHRLTLRIMVAKEEPHAPECALFSVVLHR